MPGIRFHRERTGDTITVPEVRAAAYDDLPEWQRVETTETTETPTETSPAPGQASGEEGSAPVPAATPTNPVPRPPNGRPAAGGATPETEEN